ncbi:hypothetical protein [Embleya hyalina]|uniref:Terminase n=1 Tax=Embleya hyalina TaxID=516124 RepID=A0A401YID0_9ACTN|nr:hypothetical protein [Embleya hyalina]GCD94372.1 terminase [Embleya hyalina]
MVAALERFHEAVVGGELTHDDETLSRHVLNARCLASRAGIQIRKETRDSPCKIDSAMAVILAYDCRAEAVAQGVLAETEEAWGGTL